MVDVFLVRLADITYICRATIQPKPSRLEVVRLFGISDSHTKYQAHQNFALDPSDERNVAIVTETSEVFVWRLSKSLRDAKLTYHFTTQTMRYYKESGLTVAWSGQANQSLLISDGKRLDLLQLGVCSPRNGTAVSTI